MLEIPKLILKYKKRVKSIGFSGHHLGIAADIAAMALGAEWFERHYTLDRTWKGTDHAASLEPNGMRKLTRDLRNIYKSLAEKPINLPGFSRMGKFQPRKTSVGNGLWIGA